MAYYSNGSEGLEFDNNCVENCFHQDLECGCPIALIQAAYNYDQHDNDKLKRVMDILVSNKEGCQIYKLLKKYKIKIEIPDLNQLKLFAEKKGVM